MDPASPPAALVVAHPGHELRVHGWLEILRPSVFVLTDGSGAHGRSRLASTEDVLRRAGARPGTLFGRLTDRAAYEAVLARDAGLFLDLAAELAECLVRQRIATVVGDAREGYNPVHDVTRSIIDAAVRIAVGRGHAVRNYDFLVVGMDDARPGDVGDGAVRVALDPAALSRKLEAARSFPGLEGEVAESLARWGPQAFQTERLRPVPMGAPAEALRGSRPPARARARPPPRLVNFALVTQHFRRGGLETHLGGFARAVQGRGHRLSMITGVGAHLEALRECVGDRVLEVAWPDPSSAGTALDVVERVTAFCRAQDVALLHVHPFVSVPLGALAAARLRIPYVLTVHGPSNLRADDYGGALMHGQLLEGAARVYCVCREMVDSVRALAPASRLARLPNAVDLARWSPATRDAAGPWAVVARLDDDKVASVRYALEALSGLLGARFQARVFGDGTARLALERWLAGQPWGQRVRLEGHRDDLADVLAHGTAGVAGMTRVVLEAGALGLPVLLAGYDGVKGLVQACDMEALAARNFSGRGRPPLEAAALAAQMAPLDTEPDRFQLRSWIAAHANEPLTWSSHLRDLEDLASAS